MLEEYNEFIFQESETSILGIYKSYKKKWWYLW